MACTQEDKIKDSPNDDVDEKLRPFEWLTSAQSILPRLEKLLLDSMMARNNKAEADDCCYQILHLGCGSSILGELLATKSSSSSLTNGSRFVRVVNVDCERATIQRMQDRWTSISTKTTTMTHEKSVAVMTFDCIDLSQRDSLISKNKYPHESFDLVVDKSTLDCLLCTETAASVMITQVYRCLKPGGCYFIISFHEIEFLKPLLQDIPGVDWQIRCDRMERSVEDIINSTTNYDRDTFSFHHHQQQQSLSVGERNIKNNRRFVNILECHKRSRQQQQHTPRLDYDAVQRHIETVSNHYYSLHNPLLTPERRRQIQEAFEKKPNLDLTMCYHVLLDDHVRAHLEYEEFLEDWTTFCEMNHTMSGIACETMDYETAISFLEKMQ
jgi:SAM-dependent methyltransferase